MEFETFLILLVLAMVAVPVALFIKNQRAGTLAPKGPESESDDVDLDEDDDDEDYDDFPLEVVGESHYQEALEEICGGRTEFGADKVRDAVLAPEDDNPYDKNAVAVRIQGKHVGYLGRSDARKYRAKIGKKQTACKAEISGGWSRDDGEDQGHFGVCLDFNKLED